MNTHHPVRGMRKQRGLVAVIVTIALFAFFAVAVLAVDINHALMNRTKLQSAVDAAALAAAVVLDSAGTDDEAKTAAMSTLNKLAAANGNSELVFDEDMVSFTFSNKPGLTGSYNAALKERYVRVAVSNLSLTSFFMQIFEIEKVIAGSAVAGPSTGGGTCNAVPIAVCAADLDDEEDAGYIPTNVYPLKLSSNTSEMGPGNFQLLDYDEDTLSQQLAGGYKGCVSDEGVVYPATGNKMGQVGIGLNTRFGEYPNGNAGGGLTAADYPADNNIVEATISAAEETSINAGESVSTGSFNIDYERYETGTESYAKGDGRRVIAVPIIDCSSGGSGSSGSYNVMTVGCFFLLQKAPENNGGGPNPNPVYGEYIEDCTSKNTVNNGESKSTGTHRIVLYDDPNNVES